RLVALAPAPAPAKKDAREAHIWSAFLRRGETIPLKVLAFRRDNFDGEIQLDVEGLPPGVTYSDTRIDAGKNSALLLLTAADTSSSSEAPIPHSALPIPHSALEWAGPITIVGKAKLPRGATTVGGRSDEAELVREACGGVLVWNVNDYNTEPIQSRLTRDVVLAVSAEEPAPISITATPSPF